MTTIVNGSGDAQASSQAPLGAAAGTSGGALSAIDNEVAATLAIQIDSAVYLPLQNAVSGLRALLQTWSPTIRPDVVAALTSAQQASSDLLNDWSTASPGALQVLKSYAETAVARVNAVNAAISTSAATIAKFREALDNSVAELGTVAEAIPQQIENAKAEAQRLWEEAGQAESQNEYYQSHPLELLAAAFSRSNEFNSIIASSLHNNQTINQALASLQQIPQQISALVGAEGPLSNLTVAVEAAATSVTNLQYASEQIGGTLASIAETNVNSFLLDAELETVAQELKALYGQISSILNGQ